MPSSAASAVGASTRAPRLLSPDAFSAPLPSLQRLGSGSGYGIPQNAKRRVGPGASPEKAGICAAASSLGARAIPSGAAENDPSADEQQADEHDDAELQARE